MCLKPHSLHLPHSLSLLTLWHQCPATSIRSSHIAPSLFLDRSKSRHRANYAKKKALWLSWMEEHLTVDRSRCYVIESCTPTGYVYFCCGCWQFLRRFWGKFDEFVGISKHRLPRAPNTHTSLLQLPFPSKFNYAIIFLSLLFQVGGFESFHLKQHLLETFRSPN